MRLTPLTCRQVRIVNLFRPFHFIYFLSLCLFVNSFRIFFFCTGEITPTLQDVAVLFGLPISGSPVTGRSDTEPRLLLQKAFGVLLPDQAFKQKSVGDVQPDGNRRRRTSYYAVQYVPFLINILIYNFEYVMKLGFIELF